jgi:hypothetical protein
MNPLNKQLNRWLVLGAAALLATSARAAELNARELDAAIQSGDFTAFSTAISGSLAKKMPADPKQISEATIQTLITDPTFVGGLSQRQFVAKVGVGELGAFAKAAPENQKFLRWLLHNPEAMDGCLLAATPTGLKAREENNWRLPVDALAIWRKIAEADPDSRQGIDLKLATATAIAPPGRVNIGAGGASAPADALVRYEYFKKAYQKKQLAASFEKLGVWDLTKVVSSGASDDDLTWGREMVNTFRPDLRATEMMVDLTSSVWRRASPVPYTNMKTVLQGGGKCGPRSSFAVFINHAFGIPAIGVAQPAHACVAWRGVDGVWRIGYGKGWAASRLDGLSGPDFVEGSMARSRVGQFSQVEHLRWLAAALPVQEQSAAVQAIRQKIVAERHGGLVDLNAPLKPEEADAEPGAEAAKTGAPTGKKDQSTNPPTGPFKPVNGVFQVNAATFVKQEGQTLWGGPSIIVQDGATGGKQIHFPMALRYSWTEYPLNVPAAGKYEITMKAAAINDGQYLEIGSDAFNAVRVVKIPMGHGLWVKTEPVEIKLIEGVQNIRINAPSQRGVTLHSFEIKPKGN